MGRRSNKEISIKTRSGAAQHDTTVGPKAVYIRCQHRNDTEVDHAEKSPKQAEMTSAEANGREKSLLPRHLCWAVFAWTLISRLWYVMTPTNWWILHPDETYQTVEVAHSEAFGYGFRPYEYLPPPGNVSFSAEHAQTTRMGMYSLRSFLLVKVISSVMLTAYRCGVTSSPLLVLKVLHAVVTSCLPLAVNWFSRAMYKSRDIATLSAIFTSASLNLNVLGTHTLINSFISPLVFVAMVPLIRSLNNIITMEDLKSTIKPPTTCTDTLQSSLKEQSSECCTNDENANVVDTCKNQRHAHGDKHAVHSASKISELCLEHLKGPNDLTFDNAINKVTNKQHYTRILHGFLLGVCIYIRTDTILIPAVICLVSIGNIFKMKLPTLLEMLTYTLGVLLAALVGGYVDQASYGVWFISAKQWFTFNIWDGYSTAMFGENSRWFYMEKLFTLEPLAALGCVVFMIDVVIIHVCNNRSKQSMHNSSRTALNRHATLAPLIIVCIYSLNGHKEMRFIHDGIVLAYISLARVIFNIWETVIGPLFTTKTKSYQYCIMAFYTSIGVLFFSNTYSFFHMEASTISHWSYHGIVDADVNVCVNYLHEQDDVTGVFTDRSLYQMSGYAGLHKDVPMFVLIDGNFVEYDKDKRISHSSIFTHNITSGFSMFNRMSDFISAHNVPYVAKMLIYKKRYNYIIIGTDGRFLDVGYREVFRTESVKVLQRTFDKDNEEQLLDIARRTPIGNNSTVLEYEGDKLRHYGLYEKAEQRLMAAISIDGSRVGPFQILMEMCLLFNSTENYERMFERCLGRHTQEACSKAYDSMYTL